MKWIIKQHKRGNGQQEIQVSIRVKELNDVMATTSEEWINIFNNLIKGIKKKIAFLLSMDTKRHQEIIQVWRFGK